MLFLLCQLQMQIHYRNSWCLIFQILEKLLCTKILPLIYNLDLLLGLLLAICWTCHPPLRYIFTLLFVQSSNIKCLKGPSGGGMCAIGAEHPIPLMFSQPYLPKMVTPRLFEVISTLSPLHNGPDHAHYEWQPVSKMWREQSVHVHCAIGHVMGLFQ